MDFEAVNVGLWSVFPPLFAIALALITKEVIFSLVLGIMSGTLIYGIAMHTSILGIFYTTADLMMAKVSDNASMIVFLSLLGALVALITRAGGSKAYGKWASRKLKTKRSASLVTALLGVLIFIDDYFNCLTVGTVMKPVTDRHKISREKLAWLIDSTAAPICVIAPISSWSASVVSYYPTASGITGMQAFVQAIPINLYALLTITMVVFISARKNGDFGPMRKAEQRAAEAESLQDADIARNDDIARLETSDKGTFLDLVIPVLLLVVFCILSMLYYGGLWDGSGKSAYAAFGDTDAGMALSLGGLCAIIVTFFIYVPRRLISFTDFFASITAGIKAMVPALIILTLAWTISGVCRDLLSTGDYVAGLVRDSNMPVALIPAIMFLVACGLSFATGTSWGTFGILIPITIAVCDQVAPYLSVTSLAAVMGGAVFGDHCSPISDTTILSSTGAGCSHIDHVATQIPYAVTVAASCFVGYLIAGFSRESLGFGGMVAVSLPASLVVLLLLLFILPAVRRQGSESR
ncbi:MAG: Na+/H+ antiporter NhaC family protein [Spirochaetaceae bacterium]|jgi:Na+/H+ antiporter NhaC|nr:Na+/H+ antiporter NhaC family protein [Spirochaetaceae bacterium]